MAHAARKPPTAPSTVFRGESRESGVLPIDLPTIIANVSVPAMSAAANVVSAKPIAGMSRIAMKYEVSFPT